MHKPERERQIYEGLFGKVSITGEIPVLTEIYGLVVGTRINIVAAPTFPSKGHAIS